jgi:Mg2+ and Co2+ transporter CorA
MSAALRPLQDVRPTAEPRVWSCYNDPKGQMRLDLSPEEIARALAAGEETLWVELLSSTHESYLTQVSNRLGMATKALGVVATVTLPFVVVSGMWGMNFEHIPLHSHPHGFMILALAQLALGLTILAGLKWRKLL